MRRGTAEQARDYSQKADTRVEGPWEAGTWSPVRSGQRTDIAGAVQLLKDNQGRLGALVDEDPSTYLKYSRGFDRLATHYAPRERPVPKVILLYGDPGCGKTRYVVDKHCQDGVYIHEPGSSWFDGYVADPVFLLDDFAGAASGFRLDYTLRMLDRYQLRLPVKGAFTYLVSKKIYITTNVHPWQWFKWDSREIQYAALARRFHKIICFRGNIPYFADPKRFFAVPDGPIPGSRFCVELPAEEVSTDEDIGSD